MHRQIHMTRGNKLSIKYYESWDEKIQTKETVLKTVREKFLKRSHKKAETSKCPPAFASATIKVRKL